MILSKTDSSLSRHPVSSVKVLDQPTLVLNRSWMAVHTTTVRRALGLLVTGRARAIIPETYEVHDFESWIGLVPGQEESVVRTIQLRLRVPEVILLFCYDRMPRWHVTFNRKNIVRRDHHTCQYCGDHLGASSLTIDHVVPLSRGGTTSWSNCVVACLRCNKRKGDRAPEEVGLRLSRSPARPIWHPGQAVPMWQRLDSWTRFLPDRPSNSEEVA